MTYKLNDDINKFIPGFAMGVVRATISHPFEMLKLKTQMNINTNFYSGLYKGVHLSIISNSIERGFQFYWFEKLKKKNSNNLYASLCASLISTTVSLPYNIVLLRTTILNKTHNLNKNNLFKSSLLEYSRNITGSTIFLYCYNYLKTENYPIYFASIISSCVVWGVTYPIDNIKNQII